MMDRHRRERYSDNKGNYDNNSSHDSHYSGNRQSRVPSRFTDGQVDIYSGNDYYIDQDSYRERHRSPDRFFGGGGRRSLYDSPHREYPCGGAEVGFRPMFGGGGEHGGGGFRPMGGVAGGFGTNYQVPLYVPPSLTGQKRAFHSPDLSDKGSSAKLFVGSVPKTATEEIIRPLFEEYGKVLEVALIKDKRTGLQQGCCFVKYASSEEADASIKALHNQCILSGGVGPIQVRYADGERERLGAVEYKLFVGSLNKQATEKEIEEIFAPYGHVEDVYLMRDESRNSRGCGFVKFCDKDVALAAIQGLHGVFTMRGCEQPLSVRFADPKRPRPGESRDPRGLPPSGGPGVGPPFQPLGAGPPPNFVEQPSERFAPNAWHPISPQNKGPSPTVSGVHGLGTKVPAIVGDVPTDTTQGGQMGSHRGPSDVAALPGLSRVPPSTPSQQNLNQPFMQPRLSSQQISPLDKPLQSPQNLPPQIPAHLQALSYPATESSRIGADQMKIPYPVTQTPFTPALPPQQQYYSSSIHLSASQPQPQQSTSSAATQQQPSLSSNIMANSASTGVNQQQLRAPALQQMTEPLQQSPSPLAQMLSQQTQTLQARFQSSQQTFSQLQQQLQMMQPSYQSLTLPKSSQVNMQQPHWSGIPQQKVVNSSVATSAGEVSSSSSFIPPLPSVAQTTASQKCNWTEHTSPDGFKYYHNTITGESRWEKPEELKLFEQQQHQVPSIQQSQGQSRPHALPSTQVTQIQQQQQQILGIQQSQGQSRPQVLPTPQVTQIQQQQQQILGIQQPQGQSGPQVLPTSQVTQIHQVRHQAPIQQHFHAPQQLQQPSFSSAYPTPGVRSHQNVQEHNYGQVPVRAGSPNDPTRFQQESNYGQVPVRAGSTNDTTRFQQGFPPTQEWMWKNNKPSGT